MNQLRILIFIGVGISLVYSLIRTIVLRMPSRSRDAARKRLAQAKWLDANSKAGAFVKVTGTVSTKEAGDRFLSPLRESRCVALHLRALVRKGRSPRGEMVEKVQLKPFVLKDDGSAVLVEATHALFDLPPVGTSKPAGVRKLLADVGRVDANASTSRCEETAVEVGTTVTIAGTLVTSPALALVGDDANPIVISKDRAHADINNEP